MKCVLRAVGGFDGDGLGCGINFGDRTMHGGDDIFIRASGENEERSKGKQTKGELNIGASIPSLRRRFFSTNDIIVRQGGTIEERKCDRRLSKAANERRRKEMFTN